MVPISNDPPLDGSGHGLEAQLRELLLGLAHLRPEDADAIDALLGKSRLTSFVSVDRSRLHDSTEAWVYVHLEGGEEGPLTGFEGSSGVLTWPNSD